MYRIEKLFIGGLLSGITVIELMPFIMPVGFQCWFPVGGSPYRIISCERVK